MSTRDFSWGKGGRCVWMTTYHPCSAESREDPGALTYPEPLGPPRPVVRYLYFIYICILNIVKHNGIPLRSIERIRCIV